MFFKQGKLQWTESGKYYLLPVVPAFVNSSFWRILQSAPTMFLFQRT